jgi:ornithine carbamoyltransferase
MKRNLISLCDYSQKEILNLLESAAQLKKNRSLHRHALEGKTIALIFQKPSNRTRVSFEVGIRQLGGNCLYLGPEEIDLGKRESSSDVAATLSRYLDGIVARTFKQSDICELGETATIPIINGLSDLHHPCQALADIFSVKEKFGTFKNLTLAYIGDGNNVCHSLMEGCAKVGLNMTIATPKGYEPSNDIFQAAEIEAKKNRCDLRLFHSPQEAAKNAHILYTDVWISMGQEAEREERLKIFQDYEINDSLSKLANKNYIFMHCLPAHRGEEVSEEIIDGPHSVVFDQAENRLHVQKAVLLFLMS